ncbi:carboxypeptidase Y [Beauveria brongniartii RCEF 3172]|uniref:carboxypeptidase C n=1 Tax=Beauveria brongniartii RCEF 3172 TaxID=1081107 RepID=A0A166XS33_9HYPO|nr:carboxypeptidase Y [Beauveria brongniartii RCEF 3172]
MRDVVTIILFFSLLHSGSSSWQKFSPHQHVLDNSAHRNWSLHRADDAICNAGSTHFTGQVNVAHGKTLFFWFFESRDKPENKPIVIWLNGGPGASSMVGLFSGIGPCVLEDNSSSTSRNEDSWIKYANMLFIDQPAGVGFSALDSPARVPSSLEVASADFGLFLDTFFGSIFPGLAGQPLIIAGESFGGNYVPYFANDLIQRRESDRCSSSAGRCSPRYNLSGIVLINALVSFKYLHSAHYDMFCSPGAFLNFNRSTCRAMAAAVPECDRLHMVCDSLLAPEACQTAVKFCEENVGRYFADEVWAGRRSPYDLRQTCAKPPICGGGKYSGGFLDVYLNQREVQRSLGFSEPVFYQSLNLDMNREWMSQPEFFIPRTPILASLLKDEEFKVLVLNGNFDVSVNTPAVLGQLDELAWRGQAEYQNMKLQDWFWDDDRKRLIKGGEYKATKRKGLSVFTVDDAGHMAAAAQPRAVTSVFERWLEWIHVF